MADHKTENIVLPQRRALPRARRLDLLGLPTAHPALPRLQPLT
jgi:hypothetical protein